MAREPPAMALPTALEGLLVTTKGLSDYSVSVSSAQGLVRTHKAHKAVLAIQSCKTLPASSEAQCAKIENFWTRRICKKIALTGKTSKPRVYQSICTNVYYSSFIWNTVQLSTKPHCTISFSYFFAVRVVDRVSGFWLVWYFPTKNGIHLYESGAAFTLSKYTYRTVEVLSFCE